MNPLKKENTTDDRHCYYCSSRHTYTGVTSLGTKYPHWYINPEVGGTWICGKCMKNIRYHNKFPLKERIIELRNNRMKLRICSRCGSNKTNTQPGVKFPSPIWHKNPDNLKLWLCTMCYAFINYPRKYKTKQEVSEAHKRWALEHPDHMQKNSIKGCIASQKYGKSGNSKPEKALKNILHRLGVKFEANSVYKYGEIDILIPLHKVAIFVDGTIWHGDPRIYKAQDILPFGRIANDVWEKDMRQNRYLKSQGFKVIRLWEKEIEEDLSRCAKIVIEQCKAKFHIQK